ncbi:MAG: glucokinase [Rhizobiaceae bacterium]|nr:glucokinase [Hyphomicrobiales bacterium]NRB29151.1 glucokinase [Rhizobiaceae bacterium]
MTGTIDLHFPVLIGDIGGTNARFQIIETPNAAPIIFQPVRTADFDTMEQAIEQTVLAKSEVQPHCALIAAAGPITENGLDLTNCHWNIVPDALLALAPIEQLVLMNDFEAQALALPCLSLEDGFSLGGGAPDVDGEHTKAVLGPGTGLGVGILVRAGRKWIPVPGEGGHVDLGPRSAREAEVWAHLETIEGRVSAEQAVCGDGLVNLYQACCKADGVGSVLDTAAAISIAAMGAKNTQAEEALNLFCTTLGRVAGDLALTSMARGGVYVGGGIAQKILPFLAKSAFRASFEDKAPHSALMANIATIVVTHELPALVGLAAFANNPDLYLLDLEHRHWQSSA